MTVYVLIREDQNDHGYVDVSIIGIFRDEQVARNRKDSERARAREEGLRLAGDDDEEADWQVSWYVEEHSVS
jgi:hypothetical protein